MKIFHNIEIRNNNKTILDAVSAILIRVEEQHLIPHNWSLAELYIDNEDYEWLCRWAYNLHENIVQTWLVTSSWRSVTICDRECSYATALGTLLLLFTSETARRRATEGGLWVTFQKECFHNATLEVLFIQGQPKRAYKDALEAAARWLQIRHVFGIEGLQSWFDTICLQFGFTHQGFLRRLPEWLVGQGKTQAMQRLLDGPLRSETFCRLWDALHNVRRKYITVERLKAILANNCWVLPEWIDELAIQAVARIELGQGSETNEVFTDALYEPLVDEPILRWNGSAVPEFVCHIISLARFELSEETYFVKANERSCTRLQRNNDGMYTFHPSEEIVLFANEPLQVVTLVSSIGDVVDSAVVTLWNNNDEINVFRVQSGKFIDGWLDVMRPETAYFLITAPSLQILPEPITWRMLDTQGTRIFLLNVSSG